MPVPWLRAANSKASTPLPDPWPALANSKFEVQFLPGQFMMICGPSGSGKSFMALDAAIKMDVPTLYLSCDCDELTMVVRATAALTKHSQRDIRNAHKRGMYKEVYGHALKDSKIRLEFDPTNPTFKDITAILECYFEVEARYPRLIILDNATNLESRGENEWSFLKQATKDLHYIARKTKACVLVLHHTAELPNDKWDKNPPKAPPKSSIKGNITELAPTILTVYHDRGEMWVAVVKHRFGQSDQNAREPLRFIADLGRAQIWDTPMQEGWLMK